MDFGASVRSLQKEPEDSGNTLDKRLENLEKTGKRIKQSPERSITAEVRSFLYTKGFCERRKLGYYITGTESWNLVCALCELMHYCLPNKRIQLRDGYS